MIIVNENFVFSSLVRYWFQFQAAVPTCITPVDIWQTSQNKIYAKLCSQLVADCGLFLGRTCKKEMIRVDEEDPVGGG